MRLLSRLSAALLSTCLGVGMAAGCVRARTYRMDLEPSLALHGQGQSYRSNPETVNTVGSLSVERLECGQRLLVLQLEHLPAPERFAPDLRTFVVWLRDPFGGELKLGTLHYDRTHHSGSVQATTALTRFTVRVTGERDDRTTVPSGVLLAERQVVAH